MQTKRIPLMVILSLLFILQVATACSPGGENLQGERWVIFSEKQAKEMGVGEWIARKGQTVKYWTPAEKDILALESGVVSFLEENSDLFYAQGTPVWGRLDEYNRQYIGVILDGRKFVYANFFCDSMGVDWRQDFVLVMDGGDCYFQFKFDPDTQEFFDLRVNGEA